MWFYSNVFCVEGDCLLLDSTPLGKVFGFRDFECQMRAYVAASILLDDVLQPTNCRSCCHGEPPLLPSSEMQPMPEAVKQVCQCA